MHLRSFTGIFLALTLSVALAGCRKVLAPVRFTILSRSWDGAPVEPLPEGTVVGIISGTPLDMPNVRAAVSGNVLTPELEYYWEEGRAVVPFYAYAPYNPDLSGFPFDFSVKADQTSLKDYLASDFTSSTAMVTPGLTIPFVMKHRTVQFNVIVRNDNPARVGQVRALSVLNAARTGTTQNQNRLFTSVSNAGPIEAYPESAGTLFRAFFIPCRAALSFSLATTKGYEYTYSLPLPMDFRSGESYTTEINLSDASLSPGDLTFQVGVTDWSDGGNLPVVGYN